jgi:hypothetical protein
MEGFGTEEEQQEQERLESAAAAAARRAQLQREAAAVDAGDADGADAPTAAIAMAMRGARAAAAASSLLSVPAGQCYCRYDPDYNTWAVGEDACKAALYTKCRAGQLPCGWLDAYYGHVAGSAMAHTLPHEQDILGFVFDDCQPRPPCACAGVKFDGSDSGGCLGGLLCCAFGSLVCLCHALQPQHVLCWCTAVTVRVCNSRAMLRPHHNTPCCCPALTQPVLPTACTLRSDHGFRLLPRPACRMPHALQRRGLR